VLRYLITSSARRLLLEALWRERARGTTQELAKLTGLAFSTTHRELKEMLRHGLVVTTVRDNRTDCYQANLEHPAAAVLIGLLESDRATNEPTTDSDQETMAWLRSIGVPLRVSPSIDRPPLAEILIEGVRLARRDPTVARALPVGFWNVREDLDARELLNIVRRPEEKHALGFFLELTGELGGDRRLVGLSEQFRDRRLTDRRPFFLSASKSRMDLVQARTPETAARWGFDMNMDLESFTSLFSKYQDRLDR
jgi:hypothetical protein